jgi:hypothetical protein
MTHEPRLPRQASGRTRMRLAGHEHIRPGGANLRAHEREAKAFGRATTISNAAVATTTPSARPDFVPAAASNAPIPTENSIARS